MKAYTFIILSLLLSFCTTKKGSKSYNSNDIITIFQKIENEMKAHYDYIEKKGILEEPIGRAEYFFKIVKKTAPQLLTDTKSYKDEILSLLTDSTFKKNDSTDYDIAYILYNLPTSDYVDLLNSVTSLYKSGNIDQYTFELFIFPHDFISNSFYKNYKNEKRWYFLTNLMEDNEIIIKAQVQNKHFKKALRDLRDGTTWEGDKSSGIKEVYTNQNPILDEILKGL